MVGCTLKLLKGVDVREMVERNWSVWMAGSVCEGEWQLGAVQVESKVHWGRLRRIQIMDVCHGSVQGKVGRSIKGEIRHDEEDVSDEGSGSGEDEVCIVLSYKISLVWPLVAEHRWTAQSKKNDTFLACLCPAIVMWVGVFREIC